MISSARAASDRGRVLGVADAPLLPTLRAACPRHPNTHLAALGAESRIDPLLDALSLFLPSKLRTVEAACALVGRLTAPIRAEVLPDVPIAPCVGVVRRELLATLRTRHAIDAYLARGPAASVAHSGLQTPLVSIAVVPPCQGGVSPTQGAPWKGRLLLVDRAPRADAPATCLCIGFGGRHHTLRSGSCRPFGDVGGTRYRASISGSARTLRMKSAMLPGLAIVPFRIPFTVVRVRR